MQPTDPTPHDGADGGAGGELPAGWTEQTDADGDPFWVNHNTLSCTYDDPRVFPAPKPSRYLELMENVIRGRNKARNHHNPCS